jgi:hypothetical protein
MIGAAMAEKRLASVKGRQAALSSGFLIPSQLRGGKPAWGSLESFLVSHKFWNVFGNYQVLFVLGEAALVLALAVGFGAIAIERIDSRQASDFEQRTYAGLMLGEPNQDPRWEQSEDGLNHLRYLRTAL